MASGTLQYEFGPGDTVWVIYNQADCFPTSTSSRCGNPPLADTMSVREGTVIYYSADVLTTGLNEKYGVLLKNSDSTRDFNVEDVFATVTHALVEYENRISGTTDDSTRVNQVTYESETPSISHIVTHNFGIADVSVEVYNTSGFKIVPSDIVLHDENTVIVNFENVAINCKVVVTGRKDYSVTSPNAGSVRV